MQWNSLSQDGRRADCPKDTWYRAVEEECERLRKSWRELKGISVNRERWRMVWLTRYNPARVNGNHIYNMEIILQ